MLTLALRDRKSIEMAVALNLCWFLIYASVFAFNLKAIFTLIIYALGILFTYLILSKWNNSSSDFKLSKPELRILVRPNTREELSLANRYRIPFFILIWIPVSIAFIFLRHEMANDGKILHLAVSLVLSQLVLFDFINLEIRSSLIDANKG
jgi:hypothetical protein